ncbi:hypothetical protein JOB18_007534 [Solea senegalensis]|uniref:Uncharacterized protein n=1 Tax=Solea senegalensis TaxID=28829 RepID=A0AAV6SYG2_SOLSE|nr:hypothetical protein JOB18_007534 [Solea senegalensis]
MNTISFLCPYLIRLFPSRFPHKSGAMYSTHLCAQGKICFGFGMTKASTPPLNFIIHLSLQFIQLACHKHLPFPWQQGPAPGETMEILPFMCEMLLFRHPKLIGCPCLFDSDAS